MSLTIPQIVLLNHATVINKKRYDARRESEKTREAQTQQQHERDPIVMNGKRLSELNSEEMLAYVNKDS